MTWETAAMIGVIGSAFFLVYTASQFEDDSFWQQLFKIFLIMMGFAFMMFPAPMAIQMIEANNGTPLVNASIGVVETLSTHMHVWNWMFYSFLALFIAFFFWKTVTLIKERNG